MIPKQKAELVYIFNALKLGSVNNYKDKAKLMAINEINEIIALYYNDFDEHKVKIDYLKDVIKEIHNL